jgi:hypothetical protein
MTDNGLELKLQTVVSFRRLLRLDSTGTALHIPSPIPPTLPELH